MENNMAKKKAEDKVVPEVIAKCDPLYEVTYSQSDIGRNFRFQLAREEMEILKSQYANQVEVVTNCDYYII